LKIVFFTFYYPPDLSAGSFRSVALSKELSEKIGDTDELHIITTHPNRYKSYQVVADDIELDGNITIHRIRVSSHNSGMISQSRTFGMYAIAAYKLCKKIDPDFIIGTTGRLMTGGLAGFSANRLRCGYFIDLKDIFSETISDVVSRKNLLLGKITKYFFSFLDARLLSGASGVNVVSEGFYNYFQSAGVDTSNWLFFPNGVDKEFIALKNKTNKPPLNVKTILYAGNIGLGQGLDVILPLLAKQLGCKFKFVIIGDGGRLKKLRDEILKENLSNVEIILPVNREKLLKYYQEADILFLHLNDMPAFYRVLPSKIFEYAAIGKPIVAGVNGYSEKFMKDNVPYATVFNSGDVDGAYSSILIASVLDVPDDSVSDFVKHYSRELIMNEMADKILNLAKLSVIKGKVQT
jgi:glycosyltransferase involved in cell wall biosynthesis